MPSRWSGATRKATRRLVEALHEAWIAAAHLELPNGDHFATTWWSMMGPWILTSLRMHLHLEQ